jgi:hypothetical protein
LSLKNFRISIDKLTHLQRKYAKSYWCLINLLYNF